MRSISLARQRLSLSRACYLKASSRTLPARSRVLPGFQLRKIDASLTGDYNDNGELDAGDLDPQASEGIGMQDLTYDLNEDGVVDYAGDRVMWLHDLKGTWAGGADLNGLFDTNDMVTVLVAGKYKTGWAATWAGGNWNGNSVFDSSDIVNVFIDGGYKIGPYPGDVAVVPEPSRLMLFLVCFVSLIGLARRR